MTNTKITYCLSRMVHVWSLPTSAEKYFDTLSPDPESCKLQFFFIDTILNLWIDRSMGNFCTLWDSFWMVYSFLHRCLSGITALFNTQLHPRSQFLADYVRFPSKYYFLSSMFDCRSVLGENSEFASSHPNMLTSAKQLILGPRSFQKSLSGMRQNVFNGSTLSSLDLPPIFVA